MFCLNSEKISIKKLLVIILFCFNIQVVLATEISIETKNRVLQSTKEIMNLSKTKKVDYVLLKILEVENEIGPYSDFDFLRGYAYLKNVEVYNNTPGLKISLNTKEQLSKAKNYIYSATSKNKWILNDTKANNYYLLVGYTTDDIKKLEYLNIAIANKKNNANFITERAELELNLGMTNEALTDVQTAIQIKGENKKRVILMGRIAEKNKNYEQAIKYYEKVCGICIHLNECSVENIRDINQNNIFAIQRLGWCYLFTKKYSDAYVIYSKLLNYYNQYDIGYVPTRVIKTNGVQSWYASEMVPTKTIRTHQPTQDFLKFEKEIKKYIK